MSENNKAVLTEKQLKLVGGTWSYVKKDLQEAGNIMFFKLFKTAPQAKGLFPFADVPYDSLLEDESFLKHSLGVMTTVDTAVTLLAENKVNELEDILEELGASHMMKNVEIAHFAPVGQALIATISQLAGDAFTEEAKAVWLAVYGFVQDKMSQGMDFDM